MPEESIRRDRPLPLPGFPGNEFAVFVTGIVPYCLKPSPGCVFRLDSVGFQSLEHSVRRRLDLRHEAAAICLEQLPDPLEVVLPVDLVLDLRGGIPVSCNLVHEAGVLFGKQALRHPLKLRVKVVALAGLRSIYHIVLQPLQQDLVVAEILQHPVHALAHQRILVELHLI